MSTQARIEFDPMTFGVRLAVQRENGGRRQLLQWEPVAVQQVTEGGGDTEPDDRAWLRLQEDDARAIYEALADYFGHSGNDTRALRRDYDAERKWVDAFIAHLTGATR